MPRATAPNRRNVKSSPQAAADVHERAKNFLTPKQVCPGWPTDAGCDSVA
jgi:hypothetical protein